MVFPLSRMLRPVSALFLSMTYDQNRNSHMYRDSDPAVEDVHNTVTLPSAKDKRH